MYKVNGRKSLRDRISGIFQTAGMELTSFDILEDDFTTLYIFRVSYLGSDDFRKDQGFWDQMEEAFPDAAFPDAECICAQKGVNAFIIYKVEL